MTSTATIIYRTGRDQTPGPGAYFPPSDFGSAPQWTIKHKYPSKLNCNRAGYEALPSSIGTGPKYSLSSRPKERAVTATPGPNYMPPKLGSEAPASALHQKMVDRSEVPPGPGVGKYNTRPDTGGPKYSMKSRKFAPDDGKIDGPGAGKYLPDYEKTMRNGPKTGIGIKPKERKEQPTPGPGQYHISRDPPQRGAAMHIRHRELKQDNFPGPGKYKTERQLGDDVPKYSLRSRIDVKQEVIRAPYQKLPECFGDAPKWSLSIRPKDRAMFVTPGPNYMPPKLGEEAPASALHQKMVDRSELAPGPGAGKYNTRPENGGPQYTMKSRKWAPDEGKIDGPGAGKYLPDYSKVMPMEAKRTILEKFKEKKKEPGPGYVDLGSTLHGPKYTIGRKEPLGVLPGSVA